MTAQTSVLDTNESRKRHDGAILAGQWVGRRFGYVYACPRCDWQALPMRWRQGAERHGDEHAIRCPA